MPAVPFCYTVVVVSPSGVELYVEVLPDGYHLEKAPIIQAAQTLGLEYLKDSSHSLGTVASMNAIAFKAPWELNTVLKEILISTVRKAVLVKPEEVEGTLPESPPQLGE